METICKIPLVTFKKFESSFKGKFILVFAIKVNLYGHASIHSHTYDHAN